MDMINLKRSAADKKAEQQRHKDMGWSSPPKPNDYPQGAQINLGEGELEKLGLSTLPKAGDEVTFIGRGKVITVHSEAKQGQDPEERVEIQITHLGLQKKGGKSAADKIYGADDGDGDE